MKKFLLIVLGCAIAGGIILFTVNPQASRHQTLRDYTEELRAKGEKITFEELMATLSSHTNKSLKALTNLVGQLGVPLGSTTNIEVMHFVESGQAQVAWKLNKPTWAINAGHQSSWDDVRVAIAENAGLLEELHKAIKNPAPNGGFRTDYFISPTPWLLARNAAIWLVSEALLKLHEGRPAEALESIKAIVSLTDLHREEYALVSQMTRVAIADWGLGLTWEALQASNWNDEQLLGLQKAWEGFDFLEAVERGMVGERCIGKEAIVRMARENPAVQARLSNSFYGTNVLDADLRFRLHHLQSYVEQTRALRAGTAWSKVSVSLDELNLRINSLTNSPDRLRHLMTLVATPNYKPAVAKSAKIETQRRIAITAIALERHERTNNKYPPNLEVLVPQYISKIPNDCMNGQPLQYRTNGDTSFVLYSVGEDGRDNGGDPTPTVSGRKPGFWEGKDAVWPQPKI